MIYNKKRRGQFSIITAFLVVLILVAAVNASYNLIKTNPFTEPVTLLSTTQSINQALKKLLTFTVSYYCSIVNVTGEATFADTETIKYLSGGLIKLAQTQGDAEPSFNVDEAEFDTKWFKAESWSNGTIGLTYDIPYLGLAGVKYRQEISLEVDLVGSTADALYVKVYGDGEPNLSLVEENFVFLNLEGGDWVPRPPGGVPEIEDGTYIVPFPNGVQIDPYNCYLKVKDDRGLIVNNMNIIDVPGGGGGNNPYNFINIHLNWDSAYSTQTNDWFPLEYLQDGTIRFLGEELPRLGSTKRGIPRIPIRLLRIEVNAGSGFAETEFQVEDWNENYMIPRGFANPNALFSKNNMIVFLVNHTVSDVKIRWEDDDSAPQSDYSKINKFFTDDPIAGILKNDKNLQLDFSSLDSNIIKASYGTVQVENTLAKTNEENPLFVGPTSYEIHNGIVRDIVYQTALVDSGVDIPSVYYNYVITLPAHCTYYTFQISNTAQTTAPLDSLSFIDLNLNMNSVYAMSGSGGVQLSSLPYLNTNALPECLWVEYYTKTGSTYTGGGVMMRSTSYKNLFYFKGVSSLAIDSSGNVYVADSGNNRIQKFDSNGGYLGQWGAWGSGDGAFKNPTSVAVDGSGNVYVADTDNNRIQKFTSTGTFVTKWGSTGTGDGQFNYPTGVAVDSSGKVYVADYGNNRIQKFTSAGVFIYAWGNSGPAQQRLIHPSGVAVDASGNIYVADSGNNRVQKYKPDYSFDIKWGSFGSADGQFINPASIAVDSSGNVYVDDSGNNRIQKFTSTGTFVTKWGSTGTGDGQFNGSMGIASEGSSNLYVADLGNNRVQKFTSTGGFLIKWGSPGFGNGQFNAGSVGAIRVDTGDLKLSPIYLASSTPPSNTEVTVYGAVVLFKTDSKSDTLYNNEAGVTGLFPMVVAPPTYEMIISP
jgi:hypothetical protein